MAAIAGGGMKGQSPCHDNKEEKESTSVVGKNGGHRGWRHERAVTMTAKLVMAGNGGHRGWLHEEASP